MRYHFTSSKEVPSLYSPGITEHTSRPWNALRTDTRIASLAPELHKLQQGSLATGVSSESARTLMALAPPRQNWVCFWHQGSYSEAGARLKGRPLCVAALVTYAPANGRTLTTVPLAKLPSHLQINAVSTLTKGTKQESKSQNHIGLMDHILIDYLGTKFNSNLLISLIPVIIDIWKRVFLMQVIIMVL